MVRLSRKLNRRRIDKGKVEIVRADVSVLPFDNDSFDIITAFDTINFWPDHQRAISEIVRTLRSNGSFYIVNAYPKEGSKWHEFVQFKSDEAYREYLIENGMRKVESAFEKTMIIVWGWK
jgi:ubiquinone/menaquinone biosynthesis C-methylase UbiE